jgi:hypothetical protein
VPYQKKLESIVRTLVQLKPRNTLRIALLNQLAPSSGKTKPSTRQGSPHAYTHEHQHGLANGHLKGQKNEKSTQHKRQREAFH